jgi:hypothetical protein
LGAKGITALKTSIQQKLLPFQIKQTNENLTSRSGLAVFYETASVYGLTDAIKDIFPKSKSNRAHSSHDIIMTAVLMFSAGGQHMSDIREIAEDKALLELCGIKKVPSHDTIARFLLKKGNKRKTMHVVDFLNTQLLSNLAYNELTVDIDATLIESEKREAVMTYKGFKGFSSLNTFEAKTGICLAHEFRGGSVHAGEGIKEQIKHVYQKLRRLTRKFCDGVSKLSIGVVYSLAS